MYTIEYPQLHLFQGINTVPGLMVCLEHAITGRKIVEVGVSYPSGADPEKKEGRG